MTTPDIACPSWCVISMDDHRYTLAREDAVYHLGADVLAGTEFRYAPLAMGLHLSSDAAAKPLPDLGGLVVWIKESNFDLDAAEQLAHRLLALVQEGRNT